MTKEKVEHYTDQINRGALADSIIKSPIYKEFMLYERAKLLDKFKNTDLKEVDERNEIWRQLNLVDEFQDYFEKTIRSGIKSKEKLSLLEHSLKLLRIKHGR